MSKGKIYIVDDDFSLRAYLFNFLSLGGYSVECFETGDGMFSRLATALPNLILLDVVMPDCDGVEVMQKLHASGSSVPVIMLSGVSNLRTVVESMKLGALNFLMKPFDESALETAIGDALARKEPTVESVRPRRDVTAIAEEGDFVTRNPQMVRLKEIVRRVAFTDVPILLLGESGVGKEVMAKYAHHHSGRKDKPFVKINCAALPHDLLESELFGYERGAFTGAMNDKPGKFELAHTGTILLDEIGEMSSQLQSKLLHVLQDGTFTRLGGQKQVRVDARIIASTNINLEDAIAHGRFREDLYYRLNVIQMKLPPLRERREDIPQLCDYFVAKYREKYKSSIDELPVSLLECFVGYSWPGNVRQLENVIKRLLVLGDSASIASELSNGPADLRATIPSPPSPPPSQQSLLDVGAHAAQQAERQLVRKTLAETNGNRKKAAKILNISYKAMLNKLKRWSADEPPEEMKAVAAADAV